MKYWIGLFGLTGIDIAIKRYLDKKLENKEKKAYLHSKLIIQKHHNTGAILDSFQSKKQMIYSMSYVLIGMYLVLFAKEKQGIKKTGLLLALSGALSNAIDRMQLGYVMDYFSIVIGKLKHIIFNLGDIFLFVGMTLLVIAGFVEPEDKCTEKRIDL